MEAQELFARFDLPRPEPLEGFPGGLWSAVVPAEQAYAGWRRLHEAHSATHWCPVLLDRSLSEDHYDRESAQGVDDIGQPDGRAVLERIAQDGTPRSLRRGSGPLPPPVEPQWRPGTGEFVLAVAPMTTPWRWPALLGYLGPVHFGIDPDESAAILHRWHDAFGAVPTQIGEAEMELFVPHPPMDERVALIVAEEHGLFAPDEVEPVTLVERTAVVRSNRWTFWWD